MQAGKLRHRVTIQTQTATQGTFGEPADTWTDVDTVWASVEPLSGREFLDARQMQADVTTRVTIRYLAGVIPSMRVKYGTRTLDILGVVNREERDRTMELMCREKV